ncbi:hypothetical protein, partial [Paenibacillus popilliae]|uniref:hypothetical protein n=1 Tax=Paenibacillus popilliae TaxID=78057 RepID=UPI001F368DC7
YQSLWQAIHPEQGTTLASTQKTETNQAKQRLIPRHYGCHSQMDGPRAKLGPNAAAALRFLSKAHRPASAVRVDLPLGGDSL